jgi:hypothetical protein
MDSEEGDKGEVDDFAEVFATIRRVLNSPAAHVPPPASDAHLEPFELPNMFRQPSTPEAHGMVGAMMPAPTPVDETAVGSLAESWRPQEPPRIMPPCTDTMIARMGESCGPRRSPWADLEEQLSDPLESRTTPQPIRAKDTLSSRLGTAAKSNGVPEFWREASFLGLGVWSDETDIEPQLVLDHAQRIAAIEETATLLRPILRHWVQDNMHQALVRALHTEAGARRPN